MDVRIDISMIQPKVATIDIIAEDPDSAFELGQIFNRLDKFEVTETDGHGIRIAINQLNAAQNVKTQITNL